MTALSECISLYINSEGLLAATLQTDVLTVVASSNPVINFDGQWKHVALTADIATGKVVLYVNGNEVPQNLIEGTLSLSGQFADVTHLFFGQRQDSNTVEGENGAVHYKGAIDEVDLYNRALTRSGLMQSCPALGGNVEAVRKTVPSMHADRRVLTGVIR